MPNLKYSDNKICFSNIFGKNHDYVYVEFMFKLSITYTLPTNLKINYIKFRGEDFEFVRYPAASKFEHKKYVPHKKVMEQTLESAGKQMF